MIVETKIVKIIPVCDMNPAQTLLMEMFKFPQNIMKMISEKLIRLQFALKQHHSDPNNLGHVFRSKIH